MKFMGSKRKVASQLVPIIQTAIISNNIEVYIEPFVGGANIIDKVECKEKYGSDNNKYLIALLQRVQDGKPLLDEVPKELYDKARKAFNSGDTADFADWELGNIGFLASYNGRFFDGGYAKDGYEYAKNRVRERKYYQEAKQNLLKQADGLKDIKFSCCDYQSAVLADGRPKLIYCDPPYQGQKQYANSADFDYKQFWETVRVWSKQNIVLISEQDAPSDFCCVWEQRVHRTINSKNKSMAVEKLFTFKGGDKD